jgi:hypothetical protein
MGLLLLLLLLLLLPLLLCVHRWCSCRPSLCRILMQELQLTLSAPSKLLLQALLSHLPR